MNRNVSGGWLARYCMIFLRDQRQKAGMLFSSIPAIQNNSGLPYDLEASEDT